MFSQEKKRQFELLPNHSIYRKISCSDSLHNLKKKFYWMNRFYNQKTTVKISLHSNSEVCYIRHFLLIKIFINEDKNDVKQNLFNQDKPCVVGNDLVK